MAQEGDGEGKKREKEEIENQVNEKKEMEAKRSKKNKLREKTTQREKGSRKKENNGRSGEEREGETEKKGKWKLQRGSFLSFWFHSFEILCAQQTSSRFVKNRKFIRTRIVQTDGTTQKIASVSIDA